MARAKPHQPERKSKPHRHGQHGRPSKPRGNADGSVLLYGRHAVEAALANPRRTIHRLWATQKAFEGLSVAIPAHVQTEIVDPKTLEEKGPADAPLQGIVMSVAPASALSLEQMLDRAPQERSLVVVLDQVTDPQNVGAIMRTATAFGATSLITQDRHSPPETGALAKAASGALDKLPWVRTPNLAQALDVLADAGYWRVGLAGEGTSTIGQLDLGDRLVLVLGAEGSGLRPLTARHCDALARIPISGDMESLNVSTAAAIALYALSPH